MKVFLQDLLQEHKNATWAQIHQCFTIKTVFIFGEALYFGVQVALFAKRIGILGKGNVNLVIHFYQHSE